MIQQEEKKNDQQQKKIQQQEQKKKKRQNYKKRAKQKKQQEQKQDVKTQTNSTHKSRSRSRTQQQNPTKKHQRSKAPVKHRRSRSATIHSSDSLASRQSIDKSLSRSSTRSSSRSSSSVTEDRHHHHHHHHRRRSNKRSNKKNLYRVSSVITNEAILRDEIHKSDLNLSDFSKVDTLSAGKFSQVELSLFGRDMKYVILKKLIKAAYQDAGIISHAYSEKKLLREIDSPFKMKYLASFQTSSYLCLVTEYIPSCRLIDLIQSKRGLEERTCRFYVAQLVLFFETLHQAGGIFRDLKPENILVSYWTRYLKVIDFGFSCYLEPSCESRSTMCGTLEYLCPEKLKGIPYGQSSDIWSLGILIFVMLCNRFPHHVNKDKKVSVQEEKGVIKNMQHLQKNIPSLLDQHYNDRKHKSSISKEGIELLASMLAFDPDKRPTITQIKKHAWFKDLNWNALTELKMKPPSGCYENSLRLSEDSLSSSLWKDW